MAQREDLDRALLAEHVEHRLGVGGGLEGQRRGVADAGEGGGVEKIAELLLSEQLAEQVSVERQRLGAPLGRRSVVLVHVGGDVVEEQRAGERRRGRRLRLDDVEAAGLDVGEDAAERRQVEDVLQALAVGLEHHRERAVAARDLQERLGLQPLLPQRRATVRSPSGDQQRTGGVLAEPGAEERGLAELGDDELLDLVRVDPQVVGTGRRVGVREVKGDPVVRPDRLHLEPERGTDARAQGHRPGSVHAAAERAEHADAPVADLVAETLDHDRPVGWHGAGRAGLVAQEREEVPRGEVVEEELIAQAAERGLVVERGELA